jgi:hypothetical protein
VDGARRSGLGFSIFAGGRLIEGGDGAAWSYGGGLRHANLLGRQLSGAIDFSGFDNSFTTGQQGSLRLGRTAGALGADVSCGLSRYVLGADGTARRNLWLRLASRADLRAGLWLSAELQYDRGDDSQGPRLFAEVGYRF